MSLNKMGVWTSNNNYESMDIYNKTYMTGNMPSYSTGAGGWIKTNYNNYTNFRHENVRPESSSWPNMRCPVFDFIPGDKYIWRCWIRCNVCTPGAILFFRASRVANDWVTISTQVCSSTLADGQWHEYYLIQTIPTNFDRSGTTMTSAPVLEFYTSDLKTATTDTVIIDFDVKDIEVFHASEYTSQAAFLEVENTTIKIYKDEIRSNSFIEI